MVKVQKKILVRIQYICWQISFWMDTHVPLYPLWLRKRLVKLYPTERHGITKQMYLHWNRTLVNFDSRRFRPLPWYVGPHAIGLFAPIWREVSRWFRQHTGGRTHRCEFTDPKRGALHGGTEGGFMEKMFEQFIESISEEVD